MKKVQFVVDAKRYFEVDAERLDQVQEGDEVLVTLDLENQKASYIWYGAGENPANFPEEEDDFEAVLETFREEVAEQLGE